MLLVTDERCFKHNPGRAHLERPDRLQAALDGVSAVDEELLDTVVAPRQATRDELELVHSQEMIDLIAYTAQCGGGRIDSDTSMSSESFDVALQAAGSVLTAVEMMTVSASGSSHSGSSRSEQDVAYCLVRPPGHHATADLSMGFCLFNSVAVAAASLAASDRRVAIVDIDVHHGNGTQDIFYHRDDVLYASIHQYPFYPGTGALTEQGHERGKGFTVNVPLPPGATGDVALAALDEVVIPVVERFAPEWLIVSAGYDGHRADPLANLEYSSTDYGDLVRRLVPVAPRTVVVLEGGYDLDGVMLSSQAVAGALLGLDIRPEVPTSGGPGMDVVRTAAPLRLLD